jgi:hypothetical protein
LGESVVEAPGLGAGVDDVGAVGEAVDDGFGEPGVGEDLRPFAEGEVGGHDQAAAFVAFGEDLEDELGGPVGQGKVPQFIELCGYPHRLTYADTATMPTSSSRPA